MLTDLSATRSIVFDLDGTLYNHEGIAQEISRGAEDLVARSRGIDPRQAKELIERAQRRLGEDQEQPPTLTRTCMELGIELAEFHAALQDRVHPERYLHNDPLLFALLDSLREYCSLYVYTNNNLPLTRKILALLGVESLFSRLYTIEFTGAPKPDREAFEKVLEDIGGPPGSFLFVGDRRHVDLQPAAEYGIPVLLVRETADLLQIHKLLGLVP